VSTEQQAQELHDQRRQDDPDHDPCGCWDCDFDFADVTGES
jgi:hypothetical protein